MPRLPSTLAAIESGQTEGLHIGAQLYVSRRGEAIVDWCCGEARPGVTMAPDTLMLWLSAGKPLTAVAILQLCERGRCELDDPVAKHLPDFAAGGKQHVTIWHLLTHTCGFRWIETGGVEVSWDDVIARLCEAPLERDWTPGEKAGYHPSTSWYILGELVQRLSRQRLRDYVRREICEPLGMHDTWLGMTGEQFRAYGDRIGQMQNTEQPGLPPHPASSEAGVVHGSPGGGAHGPIRELGCFYEALLHGGQRGVARILQNDTVAQMISRQRAHMFDETFKQPIDWGLGMLLDSKHYGRGAPPYGYGRFASPRTFGHGGSQSSVGMCDPEHGLVIALVFNGMPGEVQHQRRVRAVLEAIYVDLGIQAH